MPVGSKAEERDALRLRAARSIVPGVVVPSLKQWPKKEEKPEKKHLEQAAKERNPQVPILRTSQAYVDWLMNNAPRDRNEEDDEDDNLYDEQFDENGDSEVALKPSPVKLQCVNGYDSTSDLRSASEQSNGDNSSSDESGAPKTPKAPAASKAAAKSSAKSASAESKLTKVLRGPAWNAMKDLPRLLTVIVHLMDDFLVRDKNMSRREKDGHENKSFWTKAAVYFNDRKFETVIVQDPENHDFSLFSASYSGHVVDSNELETQRFNSLRKELDQAMPKFKNSGNGDGGPIEEGKEYEYSSKFWNFCNGNLQLYYFYICMQKHGLLQSACSAMSKRDSHSSGESNPRASGVDRRPSKGGGDIDLNAPIEVLKSADESALIKAKRGIAENKAAVSRDDAMEALSKKHENAQADLEAYESGINFQDASFQHKLKKRRVEMLEGDLERIMGPL